MCQVIGEQANEIGQGGITGTRASSDQWNTCRYDLAMKRCSERSLNRSH